MAIRIPGDSHCDDATLVAFLDGEVSPRKEMAIRAHLEGCWKCRTQRSDLESQMVEYTRLVEQDVFPSPARVAKARASLMAQLWNEEKFPEQPTRQSRWPKLFWSAAAACLLLTTAVFFHRPQEHRAASPVLPDSLLAAASQVEERAAAAVSKQGTLHQAFRVEVRQSRPKQVYEESQLDVWADSDQRRFVSNWKDSAGVLKHAVWRPEPRRAYRYEARYRRAQPMQAHPGNRKSFIGMLDGSRSAETVERAMRQWLEQHTWTPVLLTDSLRRFVSEDGAALQAETVQGPSGTPMLRLRALKQMHGATMTIELMLDSQTRLPLVQSVRYEDREAVWELRLRPDRGDAAQAVSFEPARELIAPLPTSPKMALPVEPAPIEAQAADLDEVQVEAMYALHRLNVCAGEPVEVIQSEGQVLVRGVVATVERKEQLAAALLLIPRSLHLRLDIRTASEAIRDVPEEAISVHPEPSEGAGADRNAEMAWCGNKPSDACLAKLSTALAASESMVMEAWNVRTTARLYRAIPPERRSGRIEWLLAIIAKDHADALRAQLSEARMALRDLAPGAFEGEAAGTRHPASGGTWPEEADGFYETARSILKSVRTPGNAGSPETAVRTAREIGSFGSLLRSVSIEGAMRTLNGQTDKPTR